MKNKKRFIISLILIILLVFLLITYAFISLNIRKPNVSTSFSEIQDFPIYYTQIFYSNDTNTPELAIADAPYTFIAKINKINRTEYRNPIRQNILKTVYEPYTIYNITIIENIKGDLVKNTEIELEQMGGLNNYENSYSFPEDTGFLNVGDYYLLIAYVPFENGNIQINSCTSVINLGKISDNNTIKVINNIVNNENIVNTNDITKFYTEPINTSDKTAIDKVLEYKNASLSNTVQKALKDNKYNKSKYDTYYMN